MDEMKKYYQATTCSWIVVVKDVTFMHFWIIPFEQNVTHYKSDTGNTNKFHAPSYDFLLLS